MLILIHFRHSTHKVGLTWTSSSSEISETRDYQEEDKKVWIASRPQEESPQFRVSNKTVIIEF